MRNIFWFQGNDSYYGSRALIVSPFVGAPNSGSFLSFEASGQARTPLAAAHASHSSMAQWSVSREVSLPCSKLSTRELTLQSSEIDKKKQNSPLETTPLIYTEINIRQFFPTLLKTKYNPISPTPVQFEQLLVSSTSRGVS